MLSLCNCVLCQLEQLTSKDFNTIQCGGGSCSEESVVEGVVPSALEGRSTNISPPQDRGQESPEGGKGGTGPTNDLEGCDVWLGVEIFP